MNRFFCVRKVRLRFHEQLTAQKQDPSESKSAKSEARGNSSLIFLRHRAEQPATERGALKWGGDGTPLGALPWVRTAEAQAKANTAKNRSTSKTNTSSRSTPLASAEVNLPFELD